ncbi:tRNA 5-(aminomethyl)-2-thiouridylate-methyltransferase MnmM [Gracilibacillus alcaliphilus]|uniref:tRNA (mnm(5)s(2)U34)-methyltransferase n=1 Tax=Gracilibacillus alcaliphilus TaxID=1401441 RepID=UPI00195C1811|nr:class I SAM-dependent methyltransferase [Gracilibacillus alcaliphilus]MBM7675847.1 protein-L-isoaspartate O-methyltransferase [Gracilibacillus alcaliphilus]
MHSIIHYSHQLLTEIIQPGDTVIDATCGNGHDTLKLAELVTATGQVYAFDIQDQAIINTRRKLTDKGIRHVELIHDGHEHIDQYIQDQPIAAAIFNLGYLPKADHSIITVPDTTITALSTLLQSLRKNGRVVLVIYHGHPGGTEEKEQVLAYCQSLDQKQFQVLQYQFINQINLPPFIIAIEKI